MDILDQLDGVLGEVNERMTGGDQVGRLLYKRLMTTQDPQERIYLSVLSSLLVVSLLTDDKLLLTKVKGGVIHPL